MLYAVSALVLLGFIVLFAVVTPKLKQNNKKKEEKALYKKYLSQFDPNKSKTKLDPIFTKIAAIAPPKKKTNYFLYDLLSTTPRRHEGTKARIRQIPCL